MQPTSARAPRSARGALGALALVGLLAASLVLTLAVGASQADAATRHPRTGQVAPASGGPWYYLAVGASESVGFQPVPGTGHGTRTDDGYTNDLVTMERGRWPDLQLHELGCPGITAPGTVDGAGACHYPTGSQLGTAVQFLQAHADHTAFVTVDLGFNDIWPCLVHRVVDEACVEHALHAVSTSLETVLGALRSAGGRHLLIVGLEHADPYLADALGRGAAFEFARQSVIVFDRLNDVLAHTYAAQGAAVARVPDSFGDLPHGPPRSVTDAKALAQVCALTWMCTMHNIHPTAAGYRAIADAVAAAIASKPSGRG